MATGVYHRTYRSELALRPTTVERVRLLLTLLALVAFPLVATGFWMTVANQVAIAAIGAIGLNILTGFTGQISLGQGGFLAVGAYTSGVLVADTGAPVLVAVVAAILVTSAVGAFFGLPALRLKGLYLAIATLAAQLIILWVVRNWAVLGAGGAVTVPRPGIGSWVLRGETSWYVVNVLCAIVAAVTARNLFRSGVGRAFMAIRDQDIAAEAMGINLTRFKVLAFALSSAYVGLAGALTAHYTGIVTFERFTFDVSIQYLAMIIVGGLGSIYGAIVGAAFIILLPAALTQLAQTDLLQGSFFAQQLPAVRVAAFGLVIVLFLIFEPRGLARVWQRTRDYLRLWPFRY